MNLDKYIEFLEKLPIWIIRGGFFISLVLWFLRLLSPFIQILQLGEPPASVGWIALSFGLLWLLKAHHEKELHNNEQGKIIQCCLGLTTQEKSILREFFYGLQRKSIIRIPKPNLYVEQLLRSAVVEEIGNISSQEYHLQLTIGYKNLLQVKHVDFPGLKISDHEREFFLKECPKLTLGKNEERMLKNFRPDGLRVQPKAVPTVTK